MASNFEERNCALNNMAPLFFITNHRNYARLLSQHIFDLQSWSKPLLEVLSTSFGVRRTSRSFSTIALDQAIECSINKAGKGHGGISGNFDSKLVEVWCKSYSFRSLLSPITSDIANYETSKSNIDGHIEYTATRMKVDDYYLKLILSKLIPENLFKCNNSHVTQLITGKYIHDDIIKSVCSYKQNGLDALKQYMDQRLIHKTVPLSTPLKDIKTLKIRYNDSYELATGKVKQTRRQTHSNTMKNTDAEIRRCISLSQERELNLPLLFSFEFSKYPLALCDSNNPELLNQQQKSIALKFLEQTFPDSCSHQHLLLPAQLSTSSSNKSAIIVDWGKTYDELLRGGNRAALAAAVVKCWLLQEVVECLSDNTCLVVAGPENAYILKKNLQTVNSIELKSNQVEADTRMMLLHIDKIINGVEDCNEYDKIVVKSLGTDIIFLCIYYASLVQISMVSVDYSLQRRDKQSRYINCTDVQKELINKHNVLPIVLMNVYALSGCDTCSFIRNISKATFFQTLFNNSHEYNDLVGLKELPSSQNDIKLVEQLIIDCLCNNHHRAFSQISSCSPQMPPPSVPRQQQQKIDLIDTLRAMMALNAIKQNKHRIYVTTVK
ncbi:unnamed protein product [Didymodactylos carnosus]|uniref:Uncharacterized protein n=1 Tax=Didymodactylos carnosus TaxID=1234261 RepID=A0A8S2ECN1_9BILA|nr:unnamed protein product [Didymodactylos carnosus]CAF3983588.1 unnamed protein product [Didymodactylos carnosus]